MERHNRYDNTLIIFLSDNGGEPLSGANNLPLSGSKYTMFEGGIRVPFMMSWPDQLPQGQTYHHRISALDILPTVSEAAGVTLEANQFDGESLIKPITDGTPKVNDKPLFFKFENQFAVIDREWKLVFAENYNPSDRPITSQIKLNSHSNEIALFNILDDPGEQHNLIHTHPSVAKRLEKRYSDWLQEMAAANNRYDLADYR